MHNSRLPVQKWVIAIFSLPAILVEYAPQNQGGLRVRPRSETHQSVSLRITWSAARSCTPTKTAATAVSAHTIGMPRCATARISTWTRSIRKSTPYNSIGSFWTCFRRIYHGPYHHWSKKHQPRYIKSICGRFNRHDVMDGSYERLEQRASPSRGAMEMSYCAWETVLISEGMSRSKRTGRVKREDCFCGIRCPIAL